MRAPLKSLLKYSIVAAAAALPFAVPVTANAVPVQGSAALLNSGPTAMVQEVQWRRGSRHHRGYHRGYHRRGPSAAGIGLGLATGAIIGGAIASQRAQAADDAYAYCVQRFRSYDPASGTYLGYDGYRHPCP